MFTAKALWNLDSPATRYDSWLLPCPRIQDKSYTTITVTRLGFFLDLNGVSLVYDLFFIVCKIKGTKATQSKAYS